MTRSAFALLTLIGALLAGGRARAAEFDVETGVASFAVLSPLAHKEGFGAGGRVAGRVSLFDDEEREGFFVKARLAAEGHFLPERFALDPVAANCLAYGECNSKAPGGAFIAMDLVLGARGRVVGVVLSGSVAMGTGALVTSAIGSGGSRLLVAPGLTSSVGLGVQSEFVDVEGRLGSELVMWPTSIIPLPLITATLTLRVPLVEMGGAELALRGDAGVRSLLIVVANIPWATAGVELRL